MTAIDYTGHLLFKAQGTAAAVRAGTKLITRRLRKTGAKRWRAGAWARCYERDPRAGGEPFGRVLIASAHPEPLLHLLNYGPGEVAYEGFPGMAPADFLALFRLLHGLPDDANPLVWRVVFGEFTPEPTP